MKRKILILTNNSGGLYCFRNELISALAKGNDVVSSSPFDDKVPELEQCGTRMINTHVERRGMNPLKDLSLFFTYLKLLKQENPDMVITYTIKPNVYGGAACRVIGKEYVANITGLGTAFEGQSFLRKLVTVMYKFALKKAKIVNFENVENMQMFIDEGVINKDQAKLLNGAGVNLEKFVYIPYPEDTDAIRFLFIGRVMAEKGVDELFAAMRKLRTDGIRCSLDMLGGFDEDYEAKIQRAESEGWLRYRGYQSDVRPFIKNCHCFVLPSWHEGMANTNLECAASGRPIITSNIAGCREAVEDGISGYLCEPKNAHSLYAFMKKFTQLPYAQRKAMGLAGRWRMEAFFDKKKVVEETIARLQ